MGIGFALIFGADTAYLWVQSGDPLHRFHVSLRGVEGDNPGLKAQSDSQGMFDTHGTLAAPRWLQSLLVVFVNQNFGIFFWAALPAALIMLRSHRSTTAERRAVRLFGSLSLVWFVTICYVLVFLFAEARYLRVVAAGLTVPLAIAFSHTFQRGRWLGGAILAALLASDVCFVVAQDNDLLFGERALVAFMRDHPGPVYTAPTTRASALWLLQVAGIPADAVIAAPPPPGAAYFFDPHPRRGLPADWPVQGPGQGWTEVARFAQQPRPLARLARLLGIDAIVPPALRRKLDPDPRVSVVYHVPPSG
jgi:hypothetical protein